jgi:lipoprotein-anchoring transpeptidase ErfK/SrfK
MARRVLAFAIVAVTLGGCLQQTHQTPQTQQTQQPASDAGWTPRDQQLMSNLPYRQVVLPDAYRRQIVQTLPNDAPGTILIDTENKFLYYLLPQGQAIRYGIIVGEQGQAWSGIARIGRQEEWPAWTPTPSERQRLGPLPAFMPGGPSNPMGARGMYLFSGDKDTLYRIHGTNQPQYIGSAISSGCIRLTNEDAIDLYNRVKIGTPVVVYPPGVSLIN